MKIENLHIGYSSILLEIEEMNLEPGKVYALVGANGRGKSTLIKTLIGETPLLGGSIKISNEETSLLAPIDKSKTFGFVQSRFAGVPYLRTKEFVALGRSPYTNAFGRLSERDESIVNSSLKTMEVEHLANRFTEELSDGERQMLSIAKVLAQETQYIFLDEPTAFLDYSNKKRVLKLLTKLARDENKCILYSSHDLEMTLAYSDTIICIQRESSKLTTLNPSEGLKKLISTCFEK